jgi:hypothetical protein
MKIMFRFGVGGNFVPDTNRQPESEFLAM